ncbi:hypothetical protein SFE93_004468 [Salmonella enterica]|nr:hypothetical protein [Salmonella enterica]
MNIILILFVYIPAALFYLILIHDLYRYTVKRIKRRVKTEILESFRSWKGKIDDFEQEIDITISDSSTIAEITASDIVAYEDNKKRNK